MVQIATRVGRWGFQSHTLGWQRLDLGLLDDVRCTQKLKNGVDVNAPICTNHLELKCKMCFILPWSGAGVNLVDLHRLMSIVSSVQDVAICIPSKSPITQMSAGLQVISKLHFVTPNVIATLINPSQPQRQRQGYRRILCNTKAVPKQRRKGFAALGISVLNSDECQDHLGTTWLSKNDLEAKYECLSSLTSETVIEDVQNRISNTVRGR